MSSSTPPSPSPSETAAAQQQPVGRATAILLGLAALPILIAVVAKNGSYGYFSDEFYYLACSDHLAWGYVDHPPLSIALLALIRAIFGDGAFRLAADVDRAAMNAMGVSVLTGHAPGFDDLAEHVFQPRPGGTARYREIFGIIME